MRSKRNYLIYYSVLFVAMLVRGLSRLRYFRQIQATYFNSGIRMIGSSLPGKVTCSDLLSRQFSTCNQVDQSRLQPVHSHRKPWFPLVAHNEKCCFAVWSRCHQSLQKTPSSWPGLANLPASMSKIHSSFFLGLFLVFLHEFFSMSRIFSTFNSSTLLGLFSPDSVDMEFTHQGEFGLFLW